MCFVLSPPESNHFLTGQNNLTHASDSSGEKAQPAASIQPSTFLVCAVHIQEPGCKKPTRSTLLIQSAYTQLIVQSADLQVQKKVFQKPGSTVLWQTLMLFQPFFGDIFSKTPSEDFSKCLHVTPCNQAMHNTGLVHKFKPAL